MSKRQAVSGAARAFVDGMRCIPFLLFAYIVYYGLPSLGLRLDNWTSGLAALIIYNAAYMAEILRGAWVVQPREPIEAGVAFGFSEIKLFRRIILPPLLLSAGTDPCRKLDPVAALCSVRGLHHRGVSVLGTVPHHRGRGKFDRPRRRSTPIGTHDG
jgi:hypothetical protein